MIFTVGYRRERGQSGCPFEQLLLSGCLCLSDSEAGGSAAGGLSLESDITRPSKWPGKRAEKDAK